MFHIRGLKTIKSVEVTDMKGAKGKRGWEIEIKYIKTYSLLGH